DQLNRLEHQRDDHEDRQDRGVAHAASPVTAAWSSNSRPASSRHSSPLDRMYAAASARRSGSSIRRGTETYAPSSPMDGTKYDRLFSCRARGWKSGAISSKSRWSI